MVSNGPAYQAGLMTHMYDFQDINSPSCRNGTDVLSVKVPEDTLFGFLVGNKQFSKMTEIVIKSKMETLLSEKQSNFTFFITPNESLEDLNVSYLDVGLAKQIVKMSLLDNRIPMRVLKESPCRYLYTKNEQQRLFVTCLYDEVVINNNAKVIMSDKNVSNGVIHVVNNLLIPTNNTYMN